MKKVTGRKIPLTAEQKDLLAQCGKDALNHPLEVVDGVLRFQGNRAIEAIMRNPRTRVDLNELWVSLNLDDPAVRLGLRAFYRDMGYSLCGYLEIFGDMLDREEQHRMLHKSGKPS